MRNVQESLRTIFRRLPGHIRAPLERAAPFYEAFVQEIILRSERPVAIECGDTRFYLAENGAVSTSVRAAGLLCPTGADIAGIFRRICDYSVYARQRELNSGYITIENGVRVGVCGTAVQGSDGIMNIKDITTLSFRAACEIIGCSRDILGRITPLDGLLVCGAPCSGKTTVLRDAARVLSERYKVSIIDERNEISATVGGVCGYDIGMSDVLVGMKKGEGMLHALRSLSPDILVCDELGGRKDADALRDVLRSGTAVIASVHAWDLDDLRRREITAELLNTGAFRYIALLGDRRSAGEVRAVYQLRDV